MNVLKHRFTSAKTDGADATQVQPSHWNDGHGFTGGAAGDVLTRDPTDAAYGAKWQTPTPSTDSVIVTIPHGSLTFTGGLVVTAGQLSVCRYIRHGRDLHFQCVIAAGTISAGAAASVGIAGLPWAATTPASPSVMAIASLASAAGWGVCMAAAGAGAEAITMNRFDFAAWPASAGGAYFYIDMLIMTT